MAAPKEVVDLVERFGRELDRVKGDDYYEQELCTEYLNPLLEALGWDITNKKGLREVRQQKRVGPARAGERKAPDYGLSVGNRLKWYLDAKRPKVAVQTDMAGIRQVRRYGWSKELPVSVVSDFEHLAIYDTRVPVRVADTPDTALAHRRLSFRDYVERWDELEAILGYRAVAGGSLEKLVGRKKKGVQPVDERFLDDLDGWRALLAKDIHKRNDVSVEVLNDATQRILNRIIFLRIGEDRGFEIHGRLRDIARSENVYGKLSELFLESWARYDSELFKKELLPELNVGDEVLKTIFAGLYDPAPYEFSAIPPDILGHSYERFLGKTIHVDGRGVRIEEKPEVRKAGGVYYTPTYIVDYIVEHTVGPLLKDKTPRDVEKLAIVDPACGSGSFLIGAFQFLINWHIAEYRKDEAKNTKGKDAPLRKLESGDYDLSVAEKRRILLNNIYGVDLDRHAVEVAKLSLSLKLLENEGGQMQLFGHERVLPGFSANIKCGNSLISTDYEGEDDVAMNVFNWEHEFSEIFGRGGFDAVIGNPPYVRQERLGGQKEYFEEHYAVYAGTADLYAYFIERAHGLLSEGGMFGMICSNKFIKAGYGRPLRKFLASKSRLVELTDFGELPVFENAATFPVIIITTKGAAKKQNFIYAPIKTLQFSSLRDEVSKSAMRLDENSLGDGAWLLVSAAERNLLEKLRGAGTSLGEYVDGRIFYGIKTGLNEAFVIDGDRRGRLIKEDSGSAELIKPFVDGDDVRRYRIEFKDKYVILMPNGWTRQKAGRLAGFEWLRKQYPAIASHLYEFHAAASKRADQGEFWWELRPCKYIDEFEKPKIIYPEIAKESRFTLDKKQFYSNKTTFIIPIEDYYLLGLLNSGVVWQFLKRTCSVLGDPDEGGRLLQQKIYLTEVPIPNADEEQNQRTKQLVQRVLELHEKLVASVSESEQTILRRQIETTDREIDQLIYMLYGLNDEEIRIIESGAN